MQDLSSESFFTSVRGAVLGDAVSEQKMERLLHLVGVRRRRRPWLARCEGCEWPLGALLVLYLLVTGALNEVTFVLVCLVIFLVGVLWPLLRDCIFGDEFELA